MQIVNRGSIVYPDRKKQILDFKDLLYGKITPTDIDGVIEYKNKGYVFFEVKLLNTDIKFGQRLALERLVLDTTKAGKKSIALILEHETYDCEEIVNAADCEVREVYWGSERQWRKPARTIKTKECIDSFIQSISWAE